MFNRERYKVFHILKKSGKYRLIEEPEPDLKVLQKGIVKQLHKIAWPSYLYGLDSSAISNALEHYGSQTILKFDLSEFFLSTTLGHYYYALESLRTVIDYNYLASIADDCFIRDLKSPSIVRLPTGAPTSPFLSSIAFWPADLKIQKLCIDHGLKYTRYVDDLTFSGIKCPNWLDKAVIKIVKEAGFRINFQKTKRAWRYSDSQVVTGVLLNNKPTTTRDFRHNIRAELDHYARNNKPLDAPVLGRLNYLKQLQPEKFMELIEYFQKRRSRYGFQSEV